MIGKVSRGTDTAGLLRYLFGPGRANEHTDPHVVAAWDDTVATTPRTGTRAGQRELARLLDQPLAALARQPAKTVWHCSIRTAPEDRLLTDEQWADAAREVLYAVGLAPRADAEGCRWVAVRHADDHIHLAVTLARQDGRPARTSHDFARVGQACQTLEIRFGLTTTATRDRTSPRRPSRAEQEKARRTGASQTPRETLRREVRVAAAGATDFPSFVQLLRGQGVMVKQRLSTTNPGEVTGYAVAWPGDHTADGKPVWFGGGKLSPDLSLPRLQAIWARTGPPEGDPLQHPEHHHSHRGLGRRSEGAASSWSQAAALSARAARLVRTASTPQGEIADVLAATATLLVAAARALEGVRAGPVTRAAEAYERAGIPMDPPSAAPGSLAASLRTSARALRSSPGASRVNAQQLLLALAELARATASHHRRHARLTQAGAAQQASTNLHDGASGTTVRSRHPVHIHSSRRKAGR